MPDITEFSSEVRAAERDRPQDVRTGLDAIDHAILARLENDARVPNNALAAHVGIAPSTCLARVRALRERGVIRGFRTDIDPVATGRPLQAMISVRLQAEARRRMRQFEEYLTGLPGVRDVFFIAGVDDYLLHVATADTASLRDFVMSLNALAEVAGTQTSLIFDHIRARDY